MHGKYMFKKRCLSFYLLAFIFYLHQPCFVLFFSRTLLCTTEIKPRWSDPKLVYPRFSIRKLWRGKVGRREWGSEGAFWKGPVRTTRAFSLLLKDRAVSAALLSPGQRMLLEAVLM